MTRKLEGKVALVTGASRGIGRGISLQLADAGAKVYITGREPDKSLSHDATYLPSLIQTVKDISDRGGNAVPIYCDHSNADDVAKLFERIASENNGQLDVLVNSAYSAVKGIALNCDQGGVNSREKLIRKHGALVSDKNDLQDNAGKSFFECDPLLWDAVNNVGLRNNYICCVHASRMMTKNRSGLIVNISSAGGLQYTFNVAYGVGKAAVDRMSSDMAVELAPHNVTIVSLWPGVVMTEFAKKMEGSDTLEKMTKLPKETLELSYKQGESPEFPGKAVVALASDPKIAKKNGKILLAIDVAREYGFKDINGKLPMDMRQVSTALVYLGWPRLACCVPSFLRVPLVGLHMAGMKF